MSSDPYHDGMRRLQDRYDTRRLADRLDERLGGESSPPTTVPSSRTAACSSWPPPTHRGSRTAR